MSKGIFLYSEDKKYKCAFELAETTDHFGCPDHSVMVLFEERENGTYVIAQAKDKLLETEKDKQLADLKAKLAESEKKYEDRKQFCINETRSQINIINKLLEENAELTQQLAEKEKENLKLKGVVDSFDKLKQYHKDAKQLIFLNPDNVYSNGHKLIIKTDNQDKISFAVEKLEKVKRTFIDVAWEDVDFAIEIIDNQIKQLKEGK